METFTDYYAVLGVDVDASPGGIKAAFKKLALQYHPDVYKGEDAEERMRILLLAYQTLSDPATRKDYDVRRLEQIPGGSSARNSLSNELSRSRMQHVHTEASSAGQRKHERAYAFPALQEGFPAQLELGDMAYDLSAAEASMLREQGMLRGTESKTLNNDEVERTAKSNHMLDCHRCHHHWTPAKQRIELWENVCPSCKASDWAEYLLLRCTHCHAVFESEQIRYEVGAVNYGDGTLCPPYELFPLCPYCRRSGWCPAEDTRVETLRRHAARQAAMLRLVVISLTVVVVIVLGTLIVNVLH